MISLINLVYCSLEKKTQRNILILIIFMLLSSFMELFSIAVYIPFLTLLLNNFKLNNSRIDNLLESLFGNNLIPSITIIIILATILAGLIRYFSLNWSSSLAANISNELVYKAYKSILYKDYNFHLNQDKNKLISIIHTNGARLFYESINPALTLLNSILFILIICISLLSIDWRSFMVIILTIGTIYYIVSNKSKKSFSIQSRKQVELSKLSLERLDVELNSIECIILGNQQDIYSRNYREIDKNLKTSQALSYRLAVIPRIFIEYFLLILLVLVSIYLSINGNIRESLPIMAGAALVAQKVFPYAQKIFESWATLSTGKESLLTILNLVKEDKNQTLLSPQIKDKLIFSNLEFINVVFSYSKRSTILNNINLKINKGDKIAIMGVSGSGKSTLIRLICGLLVPNSGNVYVNGEIINKINNPNHMYKWMRSIGYVPQKVNLAGRTLRENIVFGSEINDNKSLSINEIINITCLEKLVRRCNGLDTEILQNSLTLSGGESQLLSIARALYRNPRLLLMDEPTSALDIHTQKKIFDNILKLSDMTCIVITHRLETKELFDRIIEIKDGYIVD